MSQLIAELEAAPHARPFPLAVTAGRPRVVSHREQAARQPAPREWQQAR
jgi:hypothetical protein